ncbi:LysR substrate-binding domain-containing protein [Paracoccus sp. (in: a-proteobacteria)]|uniref:LysR substrate-binding domain-containing protein n=1 Tax=Paracoccus sp. TaxID=267 RepID=UPI0026E08EB3|nr:LysR substrate-binding domain-containing protein [Paracoccus sp. (in: a-proteobacteria)]MDO5370278.1 LysR substrate-binding domain-containing protein [Paracoccus sp. (in: a-proteobacteria)]
MSERPFRLPPLNALRVFHAVMRHRSFRAAADELLVSPQAVSQQIKLLEDTLAVELFERKGRAIEPNEQAILLAHYVQSAFDEMEEGVRRITKVGRRNRVNLNASPYFATRYLLDRLGRFRDTLPDADLRLTTMVELPDFVADDVDVAIQWGYGGWKPYEARLLLHDYKEICCTPELARRIAAVADLKDLPLLHHTRSDRLWGDVLAHLGVTVDEGQAAVRFDDAATMRRATIAGMGVGLISTIDADEDLRLGKLVAPFGRGVMRKMPEEHVPGFYLVIPKAHRRVRAIAAFCEWLEGENWVDSAALG